MESSQFVGRPEREVLAPRWHTFALIALIIGVAVVGTFLTHLGTPSDALLGPSSRIVSLYGPMIVVQWSLVLYVCRIGRPRNVLPLLLGKRWTSVGRAFADVSIAAMMGALIEASELAWRRTLGPTSPSVLALLPHGATERLVWAFVAVSVGFCEEVVYRGYLQTQLTAFTRQAGLAIVLQGALFGLAHAEQGGAAITRFALYGCMLGAVALRRRSLLPGIACHVGIDLASGLLRA